MTNAPPDRLALGLDLGASHMAAALVDGAGTLQGWRQRPVDRALGPQAILGQATELLRNILAGFPERARSVVGVGLGLPGLVDRARNCLLFAPNLAWRDFPVGEWIAAALGLSVRSDNDVRLATLAEWLFGAGRGCSDLLGVWIGTGVGGGMVIGGRLFRGPGDSAGEIGHLTVAEDGPPCSCGSRGCLEAAVAGPALAAGGRALLLQAATGDFASPLGDLCGGDPGRATARLLAIAAARGDRGAREVLARAGRYLGIALAGYCNICNPERIVIGGGVAGAGEYLLEPARREIALRAMPVPRQMVRIVPSQLGGSAVVVGAAALVLGEY